MSCDQEWTPKEGDPLPIHDMANSHLRNAYAALLKYDDDEAGEEWRWDEFHYNHVQGVLIPALEEEFARRGMVARPKRDVDEMFREGGKV